MTNMVWSARLFDCVDDGVFRGRGDHCELCGLSWAIGPLGKWPVGSASIMVHGAAVARELGGQAALPPWICRLPLWGLRTQWLAYNVFAEYKNPVAHPIR